jgi:hypothetical protein
MAKSLTDQAGSAKGFGKRITEVIPEVTVKLLRRWYKNSPLEELVLKSSDGYSNLGSMKEFRRFMSKCC